MPWPQHQTWLEEWCKFNLLDDIGDTGLRSGSRGQISADLAVFTPH
jgi:hypothetical protein